ncbi:MAG: hypothetical protein ACI8RZ_006436 [Myxococcota bacterium]|jgi:hypothetical protein
MMKRFLKLLAAILAFVLLVLLAISVLFVDTMRPQPAAPELSRRAPVPSQTASAVSVGVDDEEVEEVRVYGRIEDADTGARIYRAQVQVGGVVTLVEDGRYEVWLRQDAAMLEVTAPGFYSGWFELPDEASGELEHDFALLPSDEVSVFCAGLPGDSCADVLLTCSDPLLPFGRECRQDVGLTRCKCPDGEAAIRGGGRSVLIGADDVEAWLDFRDTGSLSGRVVDSGQPVAECHVGLLRIPVGLEDVPRGLLVARKTTCDAEGRFTLPGLVSGDWELIVHTGIDQNRTLTPRRLGVAEHLDIGDVELWAGGGIEGVLIDGLTGEPTQGPILAIRSGESDERFTPMGGETDYEGHFQLNGLPPGSWRVSGATSPHESVTVEVEDGVITDGVIVQTSDATALATNGFTLLRQDGVLIVDAVSRDSPAWDAGLETGDVIEGITMAGFSMNMDGKTGELAQLILGGWDGPGITLLVSGPDGPEEIPLTW